MKALSNLRNTIPTFFQNFVDVENPAVEIHQLMEFPDFFIMLSYDTNLESFMVGCIGKSNSSDIDEADLIDEADRYTQEDFDKEMDSSHEFYTQFNTLEDYANWKYAQELGIEC